MQVLGGGGGGSTMEQQIEPDAHVPDCIVPPFAVQREEFVQKLGEVHVEEETQLPLEQV